MTYLAHNPLADFPIIVSPYAPKGQAIVIDRRIVVDPDLFDLLWGYGPARRAWRRLLRWAGAELRRVRALYRRALKRLRG
jgi:hypothetical protein